MKNVRMIAAIGVVVLSVQTFAQAPAAQPVVSLKIQVVLSRYQGDKKISSFPYTFSVTTDRSRAELRMGSQIPVVVTVTGTPTTTYKDVGTSIYCMAGPAAADKF